jgi:hypothetical protein
MVLSIGLLCGIGCATNGWQAENVPLPRSTPFDSNHFARNAYLEGFRHGYRTQTGVGPGTADTGNGQYADARRQGFYAGAAQARAEGAFDIK